MSKATAAAREEWTRQQIARAEYFVACMFLGPPLRYDKRRGETLEEARQKRSDMEAEYAADPYRRPIMIYAVTKGDNLSIHVE